MGLAPYGEPKYVSLMLDRLIELKSDGSLKLNMKYFNYLHGLTMTNGAFDSLFGGPPRKPNPGSPSVRWISLPRSKKSPRRSCVCTPKDAYTCFMRTEMDHLVLVLICPINQTSAPTGKMSTGENHSRAARWRLRASRCARLSGRRVQPRIRGRDG